MNDVDLGNKSLADLKYIAQLMGFSEYDKLKKKELIEMISEAEKKHPNTITSEKAKPKQEKETTKEDPVPKKRGRKKTTVEDLKKAVYEELAEKSTTETPSDITSSTDNLSNNETVSENSNTVKRGRGRPSRNKTTEKKQENLAPFEEQEIPSFSEAKKTVETEKVSENVEAVKKETPKQEKSAPFVIKTGSGKKVPDNKNRSGNKNSNKSSDKSHNKDNKDKTEKPIDKSATKSEKKDHVEEPYEILSGMLDVLTDGYGFLRSSGYLSGPKDVYVAPLTIKKNLLKTGDKIIGKCRMQKDNEKFPALFEVLSVNELAPEVAMQRKPFESLIPIYPDEKFKLEIHPKELSTRLIDLISPIGKGQRGIIVSPPKAGKTVLLKKIANSITTNYPEVELIVLLIDERPEEVTDMRESIKGDVVSSTFDEVPERHIKVAEMVIERAQRLVEHGKDVVILLDSMTRLARAYNLTIPPTGRTLSGGLDPGALHKPKRFFGSARNIRDGGSLTIVSTALVDTGSKMDEVIYEEFKGTGNMELHLDRKLSEKRIFPAIDINKSGTRKEELLLSSSEINSMWAVRKAMTNLGTADVTEMIVNKLLQTKTNEEFIKTINTSFGGKLGGKN